MQIQSASYFSAFRKWIVRQLMPLPNSGKALCKEQFSALQELVNQAREKGQEVPEAVSKGLSDAAVIGAIAGDTEAIWQIMADATEGNEEYEKALKDAEENGLKLPEAVSTGIGSNQKAINDAVNRSYEDLQRQVDRVFSKGIQTDLDMYSELESDNKQ